MDDAVAFVCRLAEDLRRKGKEAEDRRRAIREDAQKRRGDQTPRVEAQEE